MGPYVLHLKITPLWVGPGPGTYVAVDPLTSAATGGTRHAQANVAVPSPGTYAVVGPLLRVATGAARAARPLITGSTASAGTPIDELTSESLEHVAHRLAVVPVPGHKPSPAPPLAADAMHNRSSPVPVPEHLLSLTHPLALQWTRRWSRFRYARCCRSTDQRCNRRNNSRTHSNCWSQPWDTSRC